MSQITTAKIVEYDGCNMLIIPQEPISREMIRKQVKNVELRLCDGRECTSEQRRKIFAIIGESVVCENAQLIYIFDLQLYG